MGHPYGCGLAAVFLASALVAVIACAVAVNGASCAVASVTPPVLTAELCVDPWPADHPVPNASVAVVSVHTAGGSVGRNLTAVAASINGVDALPSFAPAATPGVYNLTHVSRVDAASGEVVWPWAGLAVSVTLAAAHANGTTAAVATLSVDRLVAGSPFTADEGDDVPSALRPPPSTAVTSVCFGDVDGDGDVDVAMGTSAAGALLWVQTGDGGFLEEGAAWGMPTTDTVAGGCAFGDADGDGDLDLVMARNAGTQPPLLLLQVNAGTLADAGAARGVDPVGVSAGVAWGDVDGDGDLDLFVAHNSSHPNALFVNAGGGHFADDASVWQLASARASVAALLVDLNADGRLDCVVAGDAVYLYAAAVGGFKAVLALGADDDAVAVADVTADGSLDVVTRHLVLVNNGSAAFDATPAAEWPPAAAAAAAGAPWLSPPVVTDANLDGTPDVALAPWLPHDWLQAWAAGHVAAAAAADVDGDGDEDVVVVAGGQPTLLHSHGAHAAAPAWLKVRPLTARGAPSAYGAVVRAVCVAGCGDGAAAATVAAAAAVTTGGGYDVVLAVPAAHGVYNVSVVWPGAVAADWRTFPALGGVSAAAPAAVLVLKPPGAVTLAVSSLLPPVQWGASTVASTSVALRVVTTPPTPGLVVATATVDGVDVADTWLPDGAAPGEYTVSVTTPPDDELWPWRGLVVAVAAAEDAAVWRTTARVVAGSTMELAATAVMPGAPVGSGSGVCVGDFDGDDDEDVFVTSLNTLWVNTGGVFEAHGSWGGWNVTAAAAGSSSCAWADVNGDVALDLVVGTAAGNPNWLFVPAADGAAVQAADTAGGMLAPARVDDVAVGDVDGDGDVDVYLASSVSANLLFLNTGAGDFVEAAGQAPGGATLTVMLLDVDGDGALEALSFTTGSHQVYVRAADGTYHDQAATRGVVSAGGAGRAAAAADINADGAVDLWVFRYKSNDHVFLNQGGGMFTEVGVALQVVSGERKHGGVGADFDLDGRQDMLIAINAAQNQLWMEDAATGSWSNRAPALDVVTNTRHASLTSCTLDVDNDGDVDFMTSHTQVFFKNHNARPGLATWLKVRPLTAGGSQSAFGAVVRVVCVAGCPAAPAAWVATFVVDGGVGAGSQSAYDVTVGLPAAGGAYNVSVAWAGHAWPAANWSTHPGLGGVAPTGTPPGVLVVRPAGAVVRVAVDPWVPAPLPPAAAPVPVGTPVTLRVHATPATGHLTPLRAEVNGVDVAPSWRADPDGAVGTYTITYPTAAHDAEWPWRGLVVTVAAWEGVGPDAWTADAVVVPSVTLEVVDTGQPAASYAADTYGVCVAGSGGAADAAVYVYMAVDGGASELWRVADGGASVTNVAVAEGVAAGSGGSGGGASPARCAWGDVVDGSGGAALDLVVVTADAQAVYAGTGLAESPRFATGVPLVDPARSATDVAVGDVDADGRCDAVVATADGDANLLLVRRGVGGALAPTTASWPAVLEHTHAVVVADVTADAAVDVVFGTTGGLQLLVGDGAGGFARATVAGSGVAAAVVGVAVADVTADGRLDVVATGGDGHTHVFVADATGGSLVPAAPPVGLALAAAGGGGVGPLAVLDTDLDGDWDAVGSGPPAGGALVAWANGGDGRMALQPGGVGVVDVPARVVVAADLDADGDADLWLGASRRWARSAGARANASVWLGVRPVTADGVASAWGAVVRVACATPAVCGVWAGVWCVGGSPGGGYDALFGVPHTGDGAASRFNATVVFPGGASHGAHHDAAAFGHVAPNRVVVVPNAPIVAQWSASAPTAGAAPVVNVSTPVVVTLRTVSVAGGLLPAAPPRCCFVNGVQVAGSFHDAGAGVYTLTYVPAAGDGSWSRGDLRVAAQLQHAGGLVSYPTGAVVVPDAPGGDVVVPTVAVTCGAGPATPTRWPRVCVACPTEAAATGCTFSYAVAVSAAPVAVPPPAARTPVPPANMTSSTTAALVLGPFNGGDTVRVWVWATDAAGNAAAAPAAVVTRVDLVLPRTRLLAASVPTDGGATSATRARLQLACSEPGCSYAYSLDGSPMAPLGGANATTGAGADPHAVDTRVAVGPGRVTALALPRLVFEVVAARPANATVAVELRPGGRRWVLGLNAGAAGAGTPALPLGPQPLDDGEYTVVAAATTVGVGGATDVTPVVYPFRVDTQPPTAAVVHLPAEGVAVAPTVVVAASEPECTYRWRAGPSATLAAQPWLSSATGVLTLPDVTVGGRVHGVQAYVVDAAGHASDVVTGSWTPVACPAAVPAVAVAVVHHTGPGGRLLAVASATGEPWPTWDVAVDGGAWVATPNTGPHVVLPGLARGVNHTVVVRAGVPAPCNAALAASRPPPVAVSWLDSPVVPSVSLVAKPPLSTPSVYGEFTVEASRPLAVVEYRVDGGDWTPCGGSLRVGPLAIGDHVADFRATAPGGGSGPTGAATTHQWAVTAASASEVDVSGLLDGRHTVAIQATDVAGNVEAAPLVARWRVDTVPPVTTATRTSPQFSRHATATVAAACPGEEELCSFCWTSPTASVAAGCAHNQTLRFEAGYDGGHTVHVTAVDAAGLRAEQDATVVWTTDVTPPATFVVASGAWRVPLAGNVTATAAAMLTWDAAADEATAGFWVAAAGRGWSAAQLQRGPAVAVAPQADGDVRVRIAAVDLANNTDPSPYEVAVAVDTRAPDTAIVGAPPAWPPLPTPRFTVHVAANDTGATGTGVAGVAVDVVRTAGVGAGNGTVFSSWVAGAAGSVEVAVNASGAFNVTARGVDAVGNADASPAWRLVSVDLEPPTAWLLQLPPAVVGAAVLHVNVSVSEAGAAFARWWRPGHDAVGNWTRADAAGAVALALPEGHSVVQVRAVDAAGNVQPPPYASATVVVDTVRPRLAWASAPEPAVGHAAVQLCVNVTDATAVVVDVEPAAPDLPASVVVPPAARAGRGCAVVTAAADGVQAWRVRARDAAGHDAVPELQASWVVDRQPPVTTVVSSVADAVGCTLSPVSGVTVCNATTAAVVRTTCVSGGNAAVATAPCARRHWLRSKFVDAAGCGGGGGGRRRLASAPPPAFVDSPLPADAPFALVTPGAGEYAVYFQSVDAAGNVEAGNTTVEWWVDVQPPPVVQLLDTPVATTTATGALFRMAAVDDASPGQTRLWYTLNGGAPVAVPALPAPTNGDDVVLTLPDGSVPAQTNTLAVWAVDQAGHVGSPPTTFQWTVVDTAPDIRIVTTPAPVSGDVSPTFVLHVAWPASVTGTAAAKAWAAAVQVDVGDGAGFEAACADTVATRGVCVWNTTLPRTERYTLTARAVLAGVTGTTDVFTWEYRQCNDQQYAVVNATDGGIVCEACPPGANCTGGLTRQSELVAEPGWWAPPGASGLTFYECPVREACLPGGTVTLPDNTTATMLARCATGYSGTLCAVCADGYFEQFGRCAACDTASGVAWLVTFAVVAALVACGMLFFKFREVLPVDQLKVTLSMAQIIASANTAYAIPWPPVFADVLNTLRVFLIEAVSLTRASCAQPMTFYTSLAVTLVGFKVVLLLVIAVPVAVHKCQHRRRSPLPAATEGRKAAKAATGGDALSRQQQQQRRRRRSSIAVAAAAAVHRVTAVDWAKVFKITFLFLFVAYPGVSLKIMKTFKCVEVEGTQWLVADMRLRCYEGEWFGYALYASIMGCLYTAGLPAAITVILVRNRRRLAEARVVDRWGFLYTPYGTHAYLWEVAELVRKFLLSAFVVLLAEGSPVQVTFAVLVSGWAHVAHAVWKPWHGAGADGDGDYTYALQHGSLFVTAFVFLMGLLFKVDGVRAGGDTYDFLAWAMVVACVAFLAAAATLLVRALLFKIAAKRSAKRQPAHSGRLHVMSVYGMARGATRANRSAGRMPRPRQLVSPMSVRGGDGTDKFAWSSNPVYVLRRGRQMHSMHMAKDTPAADDCVDEREKGGCMTGSQ